MPALVDEPDEALLEDQVLELAKHRHRRGRTTRVTVLACKVAIREARRAPADRDRALVDELVEACFRSEDYLEGQAAFRKTSRA